MSALALVFVASAMCLAGTVQGNEPSRTLRDDPRADVGVDARIKELEKRLNELPSPKDFSLADLPTLTKLQEVCRTLLFIGCASHRGLCISGG
jgi:hypothetical protein